MNNMHNRSSSIRRADAADADALAGIIREPMVAMHGGAASTGTRDPERIALDELGDACIDTLVAEAAEGLQGFLQLRWGVRAPSANWVQGSVELRRHHVRARHRGVGVALRLLDGALGLARSRNVACMWLKVDKASPHAIGFYRKHGFRIAGTALFAEDGARREHWVMHRALSSRTDQAHARSLTPATTIARGYGIGMA